MATSTTTFLGALLLGMSAGIEARAADFTLRTSAGLVAPSTRGAANSTWFGWDSFGAISTPIDDSTPDVGTTSSGVRFRTLIAADHTSSSGNYYSFSNTPDEEVTVVTNGTPGSAGKTTVIMQLVSLFGGFPAPWVAGDINGVAPVAVEQGWNRAGRGQIWVMWELPGNEATYTFRLRGTEGASMYGFDRIEIDTFYDPIGRSHPDSMVARAGDFTLNQESTTVAPTTRGLPKTTHFGWDVLEDPASYAVPGTTLNDDTPDITSATTPAGVRFESLHGNKNRVSSGNYYSGFSAATAVVNERVTVVTRGVPGAAGKTTILAQLAGTGPFPNSWTFSEIHGVAPTVVAGVNGANRGQVWVRWELPGNEASYQFTIGSTPGQAHMSFDRIEIDTWFSDAGGSHPDSMILSEPAPVAHLLDQASGPVAPSSRGGRGTTFFGWDTFGHSGPAAVIDDRTPDIGSDPSGQARFRTTNNQVHQFAGGGNLYFTTGTLAEEVTVPTDGLPGSGGFTTIVLQISSASSGFGGATFPAPIALSSINGAAPTVVQGTSSASAQLWAKWIVPGNQPSYTIQISGPPGQAHYSFDRVEVDTKFSRYEGVGDTMRAKTVAITTESLAEVVKGAPYAVQLQADGGAEPRTWRLKTGSTLPSGLMLSAGGLLSGTPTTVGDANFAIEVEEGGGRKDERPFSLRVLSDLGIATAATLPTAVTGRAYQVTLMPARGTAPYVWEIAASQLPAGLELSAAGVISGTPTVAGDVTVTVRVTDGDSATAERALTLPVSPTLPAPVMEPVVFPAAVIGATYEHAVAAQNYPARFQITGLPKGLTVDSVNGIVRGRAAAAGAFPVQVRALNAAGTSAPVSGLLVVRALPAELLGSFTLLAERSAENGLLGAHITLTTTTGGAYSASVRSGAKTARLRGFLNGQAPQVEVGVTGSPLRLTLNPQTGEVTGTHGAALVTGWRQPWDARLKPASGLEGYYSVVLDLPAPSAGVDTVPQGAGYATFSVTAAGAYRLTGRTADGEAVTGAGGLGAKGELAVHSPLYKGKGTVTGKWLLEEDGGGDFSGNEVSGRLSWMKPAQPGRAYPGGFGPIDLGVRGGYLAASARGQVVMGLPRTGVFGIEFAEGGIADSATVADLAGLEWTDGMKVVPPAVNPGRVGLKVNTATGSVSGEFTLVETAPPLVRAKVKFMGQVVRTGDAETLAAGYFMLPQIPGAGQRPTATPVLSGAVYLTQPAAP